MARKRQRPIILFPRGMKLAAFLALYPEALEELAKQHPKIAARLPRWATFQVEGHLQTLGLDNEFMQSLTPETRVLEIGAGTGRLANYLLKRTPLQPRNYILFDKAYEAIPPALKRRIFRRWRKGRGSLKLVAGDYFTFDFGEIGTGKWHHIIMPESYFGKESGSIDFEYAQLLSFIKKMLDHVEPGGSLRMSSHLPLPEYTRRRFVRGAVKAFRNYLRKLEQLGYRITFEIGSLVIKTPLQPTLRPPTLGEKIVRLFKKKI